MFRWPLFRRDRYNSVISWPRGAVANHVLCTLAPRRENGTTLLRVRVQAAVGSPMLSAFRIQKISFQALVSIGRWVWCLRDSSRERGCSRSVRGNGDRCVCVWACGCGCVREDGLRERGFGARVRSLAKTAAFVLFVLRTI